jgi:hypothetical protein
MGSISVPCQDVRVPDNEPGECMKPVDFIYEITNVCDPSLNPFCDIATIDRFDMARNGELKDLLYTIKSGTGELGLVPLANVLFYERGVEFDFCKNKTVDTSAIVTANTAPGSTVGVCAAEASTFFSPIGFTPDDSKISDGYAGGHPHNGPEYFGKAGEATYYGSVGDYYYSGPEYYGRSGKSSKGGKSYKSYSHSKSGKSGKGGKKSYNYHSHSYDGSVGDYDYSGHVYYGKGYRDDYDYIRGPDEYDGKMAGGETKRREGYYDDCRRDEKNTVVFNNVIF